MSRINHDLTVTKPDYNGGSLVNLMRSIADACGAAPSAYPPLTGIDDRLRAAKRIVLLVVDGFGAEALQAISRDGLFANHLHSTMTSVYPPTTSSAITTIMTGLAPQQHGLTGWFMNFREIGAVTAVLPFTPRYGRSPLTESGVDIGALIDCPSFFDSLPCPTAALLPQAICDSDFSQLLGGSAQRQSYSSLDDFSTQLGQICSDDSDVGFAYAYWSEFDRLSHIHGPSSETVANHVAELEASLTRVFEQCANSGTTIVMTADHGFIDSAPSEKIEIESHRELADTLSAPLCGEPRSAYCYVRPDRAAQFEEYVQRELAEFALAVPSRQLIDEGWFGLGQAHKELAARVGDYTLQMRGTYTIGDRLVSERGFAMQGVHGGTAAAEMIIPLVIVD